MLDDAGAGPAAPTSRLYSGYLHEHRCTDPATLEATCAAVRADLDRGLHALMLADYEWGAKLLKAGTARLAEDDRSALRVLVFAQMQHLDADAVAAWLQQTEGRADPAPAGVLNLQASVSRAEYEAAIAQVHEAIRAGETYQVNYTYRLNGRAWGEPLALYRRLRARQRVGFGALIHLPGGEGWVLSRSPELFIRHEAGRLTARPMKGTAQRSLAPEGDSETARLLHDDTKNRAENLMIVDLLRNDLGAIAEVGSVKVPQLFDIEPYATVFQMTSTVQATKRGDVNLAGLLRASFPCGSITGAPKHRTMHWISQLESTPRGLYTGAIGWLDAGADASCPDLCLAVAIRTLTLGPAAQGSRALSLGVGGGIVLDSVAADEWEETQWKARFVTRLDPGLSLFETLRATRSDGVPLRKRHRARLAASAQALGFVWRAEAFDAALDTALGAAWAQVAGGPLDEMRVRLQLDFDGRITVTHAGLDPLPVGLARLVLADTPLAGPRPLARHKTTDRAAYDAGVKRAIARGAFDTLFFDEEGWLLEGGRSNVFVRQNGRWYTPPLDAGVLPGVMRAELLNSPAWAASERRIHRSELPAAQGLMVCNALRGALPAELMDSP
ncbi:aminodeoxychorismate synthase, component I [Burkholderiales bacterium JOSHI_001]|nr:aminodeoxychorismate synthase, component I [Burkholderiales bacterium JOSHI_001]